MQSRVLTIMLTDMKGFTETSARVTRDQMMNLVKRHDELLRPIVARFGRVASEAVINAFLQNLENPGRNRSSLADGLNLPIRKRTPQPLQGAESEIAQPDG